MEARALRTLLVAVLIWVSLSGSAGATPAPSCENASYNVEVTQRTQQGNHQGIRADVWFGRGNDDCDRVTSLAVLSGTGNGFVEWGWVLGYSSCPEDGDAYYTTPRTFTWWRPDNGASRCHVLGSAGEGTWIALSLADGNSDTVWLAKRDGTVVDSLDVNFDRGTIVTNAERDCTCDSAYAHYRSLDFQVTGTHTWYAWTAPILYVDTDPDYHWYRVSDTEHEVLHD